LINGTLIARLFDLKKTRKEKINDESITEGELSIQCSCHFL